MGSRVASFKLIQLPSVNTMNKDTVSVRSRRLRMLNLRKRNKNQSARLFKRREPRELLMQFWTQLLVINSTLVVSMQLFHLVPDNLDVVMDTSWKAKSSNFI